MSLIVACAGKLGMSMGSDSGAFEEDGDLYTRAHNYKIWKCDGALVGGSGSFAALHAAWQSGKNYSHFLYDYMKSLTDIGDDWQLLIMRKEDIDEVTPYGIVHLAAPYAAVGTGAAVAYGSLATSHEYGIEHQRSVETALEVSENHSLKCVRPFKVMTVDY